MKDLSKTVSKLQFFLSLVFLLLGVLNLVTALFHNELKNNYPAGSGSVTMAIMLTIMFALGPCGLVSLLNMYFCLEVGL